MQDRELELTNLLLKAIENTEGLTVSKLLTLVSNFEQKQAWLWEVLQNAKNGGEEI